MPPVLYSTGTASPPARAVEIIAKIAGIPLEIRYVDLLKLENREPWFLKLNPAHQVPVLDDNGYILTDSHAIIAYLLTVYAPKDVLEQYYPTDPKQRGMIDSRWHFEGGAIFAKIKTILIPLLLEGEKVTPVDKIKSLIESVEVLETLLKGEQWLAGDRLTVADISTVMDIDLIEPMIALDSYKNVTEWAARVRRECPFWEEINAERVKNSAVAIKKLTGIDAKDRWKQLVHSGLKK